MFNFTTGAREHHSLHQFGLEVRQRQLDKVQSSMETKCNGKGGNSSLSNPAIISPLQSKPPPPGCSTFSNAAPLMKKQTECVFVSIITCAFRHPRFLPSSHLRPFSVSGRLCPCLLFVKYEKASHGRVRLELNSEAISCQVDKNLYTWSLILFNYSPKDTNANPYVYALK